jgi:hypothetical protein
LPGTILVLRGYTLEKLPILLEEARFLPDGSIEAIETQSGMVVLDADGSLRERIDSPTRINELPGRRPHAALPLREGLRDRRRRRPGVATHMGVIEVSPSRNLPG